MALQIIDILSIFGTIFRKRYDLKKNVNPTLLKLIILSWFVLVEKYNISENLFMLNNSKCVVNICYYAPRRMYTHNSHPCFEWYIPSKSPIFTGNFKCGKWKYKWWFFVYFWKIKGMNLQKKNGIWRMVNHKLMYERGSWMGLSAWTFLMPSGIKQSFMHSIPFMDPELFENGTNFKNFCDKLTKIAFS